MITDHSVSPPSFIASEQGIWIWNCINLQHLKISPSREMNQTIDWQILSSKITSQFKRSNFSLQIWKWEKSSSDRQDPPDSETSLWNGHTIKNLNKLTEVSLLSKVTDSATKWGLLSRTATWRIFWPEIFLSNNTASCEVSTGCNFSSVNLQHNQNKCKNTRSNEPNKANGMTFLF